MLLAGAGVIVIGLAGAPFILGTPSRTATSRAAVAPLVAPASTEPANRPFVLDDPAPMAAPAGAASLPIAEAVPAASFEDVIGRALPAVVSIQAGNARGTGFFIRPDYVLTNHHVVDGQTFVELTTGTTQYSARVAGVSVGADLAVLQVASPRPDQAVLRLGTVATARPGQEVVAVGSALGVLSNTVTRGIVSAVRQTGQVTLIQTDAAINPGNSGGPLIDRSGAVIGIASMTIASRVGQGVAFAVAADHAFDLLSGRAPDTPTTPLQALNESMTGQTSADEARVRAEQEYGRVMQWAGREADVLDDSWGRGSGVCVTSAIKTSGRAWFAVYERNGVTLAPISAYNCSGWLQGLTTPAMQIKAEVDRATEAARRAGVYPGVIRNLRQRYRMDWSGFDR